MYFDWTATTPMSENALNSYVEAARCYTGNPSSAHYLGVLAHEYLEKQRNNIATLLNVNPSDLFFTSGGTESDSIIIQSLLMNPVPGEILVSGIEHSAVLENKAILEKNGWKFTTLKCPGGYLKTEDLSNALNDKVRMVCVMNVNNVTGTINNIEELVKTVRQFESTVKRKIHFHCDAVQALGKINFNLKQLDVDSAAFSSHKIYGPRGIGLLYCKNRFLQSLSKGGGQEKGIRPGTENIAAIASFSTAVQDALLNMKTNYDVVSNYRNILEKAALKGGFTLLSPSGQSNLCFSPYILCLSTPSLPSEVFLRIMSDKGFCLSAGSACSTNSRGKAESVLNAMNFKPEDRLKAIRISISGLNTENEINQLAMELENGKY